MSLAQAHWRRTLVITTGCLMVWAGFSFVTVYFAAELETEVAGWPLYFWLAAQGGPLVFLLIVWAYARLMKRLDRTSPAEAETP